MYIFVAFGFVDRFLIDSGRVFFLPSGCARLRFSLMLLQLCVRLWVMFRAFFAARLCVLEILGSVSFCISVFGFDCAPVECREAVREG